MFDVQGARTVIHAVELDCAIAPSPERYRHSASAVVVWLYRRDGCAVVLGIRPTTADPHSGVRCEHGSTAHKSGQAHMLPLRCPSHIVDDMRCIRRSSFLVPG